ncbi:aldo/keto reductase [Amycolatopsis anabasis]|uniref:aldo/keto reductase n=1 Tax=Amycolatopsis anabasis TaxID=1840409 RepID=UPI001FEB63AD|nr:aldo/keto reductase [Amycolatopsis anabasis]
MGLGCMSMSHAYTPAERDDEESILVVQRAIELGIRLFDTADIYGPFTNESLLGRALEGRRDEVVIATKCGLVTEPDGKLSRNGRPEYLRAACDASLRRLRTDVIDLYQLHRVDPEVPLEETWGALAELVTAGKVRALGMSHGTVEELERAHAVFPVSAAQYELSIWADYTREDVLPWCAEHDVDFLAFSPIGRGYLTGKLAVSEFDADDSRSRDPRFTTDAMTDNQIIVDGVRAVAARLDATPAQVAIAWVLAQGERVVPIPGTKKLRWLEENAAAADLKLSDDDLAELDALPTPMGHRRWK